jgi:hypothetical protein
MNRAVHDLTIYTAEPGTTSEAKLRMLASWTAIPSRAPETTNQTDKSPRSKLTSLRTYAGRLTNPTSTVCQPDRLSTR